MAKKKLKARKSTKVKPTPSGTKVLGHVNTEFIAYNVKPAEIALIAESMSQLVNRSYQLAVLRSLSPYMGQDEE